MTRSYYKTKIALAVALFLPAGALLTAGAYQELSGGSFGSDTQRFTTSTAAFKTDEIYVGEADATPGDPMPDVGEQATVTIVVRSHDPSAHLFLGVGPKTRVEQYLSGTAHDEFTRARLDPFSATFRRAGGAVTPAVPQTQPFWAAQAGGTGTVTLTWDKTYGPWSFVVLRTDGGAGLDISAWIGLRFGFLLPLAALLLAPVVALAVWAVAARRRARS